MIQEPAEAASIYSSIQGGPELMAWFSGAPSFHDAEIVELSLRRREPSILRVHTWIMRREVDAQGRFVQDKHVVVTFAMEGMMDIQLQGFNDQNVIAELIVRAAPDRPDRQPYYAFDRSPGDLEIEIEPCFGLSGLMRCQSVSINIAPGRPAK